MSERSHEEIRQLLEKITQNNLYVTRWKTGGGSLSFGFIAPVVIADFFRKEDCDFYLAAPDIVRQLLAENERLQEELRDAQDGTLEAVDFYSADVDRLRAVNARLVAAAEAALDVLIDKGVVEGRGELRAAIAEAKQPTTGGEDGEKENH